MRQDVKRLKPNKTDSTKLLLALVYILLIFAPLFKMFRVITMETLKKVLFSGNFGTALGNSIVSASLTTILVVTLAYTLAVLMEHTDIRYRNIFAILFSLPMLIPSISHGMGLVILFGNNGIITQMLGLQSNIYGLPGIVGGSFLYAFPVAFLMISDVLKYEDSSPYEAAQVLGIPKIGQFMKITLPYMRKALISVVFATFTLVITDYGVPLMVGGKFTTIPVIMYQEVIGQLDFGKGAIYGSVLLIPAVAAFLIDLCNKDRANNGYTHKPFVKKTGLLRKSVVNTLCVAAALYTLLPIVAFVLLAFAKQYPVDLSFTFDNIINTFNLRAGNYLTNSIVIAIVVAIIGTMAAFWTAYMSARMKSKVSKFLHLSAITSAAIPGIVLGLSYVLLFKGSPIYGTIILLCMVNMVHFISSPYLMIYNSLSKVNENLEAVGHTLGISRMYIIRDVLIPMCGNTILEMLAYFFVNCMMTISAVSFLATTANKPISLMINQFEAQSQFACAAVVSLMILVVNLVVKGGMYLFRRRVSCEK